MAHEVFRNIPDPTMAEACSQIFTGGTYKFATEQVITDKYGDGFPPKPAELLTITASYIQEVPDGLSIRTQFASLSENLPTPTELAGMYADTVGGHQRILPLVEDIASNIPILRNRTGIREWCVRTAESNGNRLLAAHIVGRVASDGALIDTLAYPTVIMQQFPLLIRNLAVDLRAELQRAGKEPEVDQEILAQLLNTMKPLLSGSDATANFGTVAASSFLPESANFRVMMQSLEPKRHLN